MMQRPVRAIMELNLPEGDPRSDASRWRAVSEHAWASPFTDEGDAIILSDDGSQPSPLTPTYVPRRADRALYASRLDIDEPDRAVYEASQRAQNEPAPTAPAEVVFRPNLPSFRIWDDPRFSSDAITAKYNKKEKKADSEWWKEPITDPAMREWNIRETMLRALCTYHAPATVQKVIDELTADHRLTAPVSDEKLTDMVIRYTCTYVLAEDPLYKAPIGRTEPLVTAQAPELYKVFLAVDGAVDAVQRTVKAVLVGADPNGTDRPTWALGGPV